MKNKKKSGLSAMIEHIIVRGKLYLVERRNTPEYQEEAKKSDTDLEKGKTRVYIERTYEINRAS